MKSKILIVASCAVALMPSVGYAGGGLTFASFGGSYQDVQRTVLLDPAAKELGLKISEDTLPGIAPVRLQVKSGAVSWDVVTLGDSDCAVGAKEGLFEPLDYSVIDASGVPEAAKRDSWIALDYFSTVLAWDNRLGDKAPRNWADFWNTTDFPGQRSLFNNPMLTLEIALLADGVPADKLYPLDVDRAFRKLEKIKPSIVAWWDSGAQSSQLVSSGEADMLAIWHNRANDAVKAGADVSFTFNGGVLGNDCLAIPKGAPNAAAAQKLIAFMLRADRQAELAVLLNSGPANIKALDLIDEDVRKRMPTSKENLAVQAQVNVEWWADNNAAVQARWDAFKQ